MGIKVKSRFYHKDIHKLCLQANETRFLTKEQADVGARMQVYVIFFDRRLQIAFSLKSENELKIHSKTFQWRIQIALFRNRAGKRNSTDKCLQLDWSRK